MPAILKERLFRFSTQIGALPQLFLIWHAIHSLQNNMPVHVAQIIFVGLTFVLFSMRLPYALQDKEFRYLALMNLSLTTVLLILYASCDLSA